VTGVQTCALPIFGIVGVTALVAPAQTGQHASTGALASNGVLFLIGLFHSSAIDMLRARAMKLFGRAEHDEDEIALTAIEGIDLTTADLLAEYGVGSVQHLATAEPGELSDRTLLPLDRILDWIDQAMLIRYRSEEHTSELQSRGHLVCRLLLEKKKKSTY